MAVPQTHVTEAGKRACHQCRQSRSDVATCKNVCGGKKPHACTICVCRKCLINRYGEKVEVVANTDGWCCPKCRGICNCSVCMKKRGHQPTGILVQTAKARGFLSVLEMLQNKALKPADVKKPIEEEKRVHDNDSCSHEKDPKEDRKALLVGRNNKENLCAEPKNKRPLKRLKTAHHENNLKDINEVVHSGAKLESKRSDGLELGKNIKRSITKCMDSCRVLPKGTDLATVANINTKCMDSCRVLPKGTDLATVANINTKCMDSCRVLPKGTDLATVANIDFLEQDVGPALQFLEFCAAFMKVLDIKKGQPELVLRELSRGLGRRGLNSVLVQFHVKLLSLLHKDAGKRPLSHKQENVNAWLLALQKCITESTCSPERLPVDFVHEGISGYDNLATSQKLRILTFLCDEVLDTEILRSWIDKEKFKYIESRKEKRKELLSDKEKERFLKQQMKDGMMQKELSVNDGSLLSLPKHDASLSEITSRRKSAKIDNRKRTSDAFRTEAVLLDGIGRTFWKLKSFCNNSAIILQEIARRDSITSQDKWIVYDEDEVKEVDKHIAFVRSLRSKRQRSSRRHDLQVLSENTNENMHSFGNADGSEDVCKQSQ